MKRIATSVLMITSVLIPAFETALAAPARAEVGSVSLPAAAAISSATVTLTGTVRVDPSATGLRSATLWFSYPGTSTPTQVGSATSRRPGFLVISGRIDATRIVPGGNLLQVVDNTDGDRRTIALDLRRKSKVSITRAQLSPNGQLTLAVRVRHYDPKLAAYAASQLSPVRIQEKLDGGWTSVGAVVTDKLGLATATLTASPGVHAYRAVRPDGATVRAATSHQVTVGTTGRITAAIPRGGWVPTAS